MAHFSWCHNKFSVESGNVVDPHGNSSWNSIDPDKLPEMIEDRFGAPLDFPPIADAVLKEDTVAIAVEPNTPFGEEVAGLVADRFVEQGSQRSNIHILTNDRTGKDKSASLVVHDPHDQDQMAYLFADRQGQPFYVNRVLFDADVVVPIGTFEMKQGGESVCAAFCDESTRKNLNRLAPDEYTALMREADSNLGVFWQIRIVPAPGDQVVNVLVGATESVERESCEMASAVWNVNVDESPDLVIATIESNPCQNWQNLTRAIVNADRVAAEDADIILCTELKRKPPAYWPAPDGRPTNQENEVADVFRRRHVYLASELSRDSAEEIGFGHVEGSSQIQKLVDQHRTCLLLRDAHRVAVGKHQGCDH